MDFAKNSYTLVKHFDRADFPANLRENLQPLLDNDLIAESKHPDYASFEYSITEKGRSYFATNFNENELLDYIGTMRKPGHTLELTKLLIKRKNERKPLDL